MRLSTKLTIAMVLLVSATAAAVGLLTYRNLGQAFIPRVLDRIESDLRLSAIQLEFYTGSARADVEGFRSAVALNGIIRARSGGGVDAEGISEATWRERMASRFMAELKSKPGYLQFQILGAEGLEIVRVDRSGPDHEPRTVPGQELQRRGNRDYFKDTIKLQLGDIYVSPVELNQENGVIDTPLTPVLRVATPVFGSDGRAVAVVSIALDMGVIFERIRSTTRPGVQIYVVKNNGDYLMHPDKLREFGSELGNAGRWQDDFPTLAAAARPQATTSAVIRGADGRANAGGLSMIGLAGGPSIGVIQFVPNSIIMAPALPVRDTSFLVGVIAILFAAGLAVLTARSLARPLVQITRAVERFPALNVVDLPTKEGGEVGVLAKAFARVLTELREKATAFEREVTEHRETERARESYEQQVRLFGAAVESSSDAIITNGFDGTITGWNKAAERLFGYTATEVIGRRVEGFIPPDRMDELREIRSKVFSGESIPTYETVRLAKGGQPVDVSISVSPIRLPDGTIIGGMVIGHDLTEIKRTRAALRQGAEERRRIFETSQDLILVTDSHGNFVQVSPSVESILGYQPSEMVGHSAVEFIHPADLDGTREEMRSARLGHMTRNFLTRYVHKDGRVVALTWMGTWSEPVKRHFFIGRDMTEMLRTQLALEESERMARGIVDTALDAFVQMDETGSVIDWNSQAEAIFSWSRNEAVGRRIDELIAPDLEDGHSDGLVGLLRSTVSRREGRFEIGAHRRDKTDIRVELSVTAFRRESGGQVFNLFIRDLTEKIAAEAQLRQSQKMDAVGQLTGGVAHDFNNILTVITGTIEILADAVADKPDLAAITQMIDEAATRGADLTRHLLAFARRQPLQPKEVDVNILIAEAGKLLRPTLGGQIEIVTLFADDPWFAFVDPNQLTNAVLNLAINARDAMPGGGKLTIETQNTNLDENYAAMNSDVKPGPYVMLAISDTGVGIPADRLEKVFEPFFTTKDMGKGTGLGLSMVYGFVKQTGGHIKIYSEERHGTTVRLYLPRSTMQLQSGVDVIEVEKIIGGDELVLVVEDDELVRNYVITQVRSLGYRTLAAPNAEQGLKIVRGNPDIDLLFTDVIMPGIMNGRQLVEEALKLRPALKTLYTSGYTENAIVHHGRLDPGVLLLAKPYRKADLARMIRQALAAPARSG